jgi:hypothetical protein
MNGLHLLPKTKTSCKGEIIVAGTTAERQLVQIPDVASSENHVVAVKDVNHALDTALDMFLPSLLAQPF